jgi:hypothetical protein
MRQPFDALREMLLRAGYSPWRVGRYCRELDDHYADLVNDELAAGKDFPEAQAAARARIGSDEALAAAMLMRPSLRSWTAKAPLAVVVMAPVALLVLACVATVAGLTSGLGTHPGAMSAALKAQLTEICGFENFKLPVLVSALVGLWAARNRLSAKWAVLGVLAVACVSPALRLHILWPGHNPADSTRWAFEASPSLIVPMWLQRFREVGLMDLFVGLAVYWAASGVRLGPVEPLVVDASPRPARRSWAAKAPWASLVVLPVVLMVLTSILLAQILTTWLGLHPAAPDHQLGGEIGWLYGMAATLPGFTSAGVALAAARLRAPVIWPILGLLAVACVGAALQPHLVSHPYLLSPGDDAAAPMRQAVEVGVLPHPIVLSWLEWLQDAGLLFFASGMAVYLAIRVGSAAPQRLAAA